MTGEEVIQLASASWLIAEAVFVVAACTFVTGTALVCAAWEFSDWCKSYARRTR